MKGTRAAIRYAKAILDLATDQNSASLVNDDMKLIVSAIDDNKEYLWIGTNQGLNKLKLRPFYESRQKIIEHYGKWNHICYSTASSTMEHPKFRLIFPLSKQVPKDSIKHFWYALNKELGDVGDPQTKDLSRMYYVPGEYEGAYNFIYNNFSGIDMNPFDIISRHDYVERSGGLLDNLPPKIRAQLLAHRKNEMTNTDVHWNNYKDCPFVNKKLIKEYSQITDTGWYAKMYAIMTSIAGIAIRKKYPITPAQVAELCRQIDNDNGNWYDNRPLEKEAGRAIEFVYSNN